MSKPKSIKKSVSFRKEVCEYAEERAEKFFGGNFSSYLSYLIAMDMHGMKLASKDAEHIEIEEKVKDNINKYEKNEENESYIDQFINMD